MSATDAKTILDLIGRQYARVIVKRALFPQDRQGPAPYSAKVMKRMLRSVDSGSKLWSEINRVPPEVFEEDKKCAYCGSEKELFRTRLIPESVRIKPECQSCDRMRGASNHVWACRACGAKKENQGAYEFCKSLHRGKKKFYDMIPTGLERKYLKTIYHCHQCAGTLHKGDIDGDGKLTVLDIDFVLRCTYFISD